jgi:hypothetical protein
MAARMFASLIVCPFRFDWKRRCERAADCRDCPDPVLPL